jgi:probable H4MPT-linked C1 transfer pathway protein
MTAELSQMFRTKREGVDFVLDAVASAFPEAELRVFTVRGEFVDVATARREPLTVAAANWAATAQLVARHHRDALLIDTGTTTTDIIPIREGSVAAVGRTDPERLASGELIYTGALRTPVEAIVQSVPYRRGVAGVSAEGFALAGDVHLWRGDLSTADYSVTPPDGRPATREHAGERLARVVCADRETCDEAGLDAIADAVASAQIATIATAIRRVVARHPGVTTAVVTGLGSFLGSAAAIAAGLHVVPLGQALGPDAGRYAAAACVALLYDASRPTAGRSPLTVIKLGGSLLAQHEALDATLAAVRAISRDRRVVIVPGGGPFADAVRHVDARIGLSDDAAHWMAVLAMDQYAHVIADRIDGGVLATDAEEIAAACAAGRVPVLAPSRWLRDADPLPHRWSVSSDSIAAWVAGQVGADHLLVIKAPGASRAGAVDPMFASVLPAGVTVAVVAADEVTRAAGDQALSTRPSA